MRLEVVGLNWEDEVDVGKEGIGNSKGDLHARLIKNQQRNRMIENRRIPARQSRTVDGVAYLCQNYADGAWYS